MPALTEEDRRLSQEYMMLYTIFTTISGIKIEEDFKRSVEVLKYHNVQFEGIGFTDFPFINWWNVYQNDPTTQVNIDRLRVYTRMVVELMWKARAEVRKDSSKQFAHLWEVRRHLVLSNYKNLSDVTHAISTLIGLLERIQCVTYVPQENFTCDSNGTKEKIHDVKVALYHTLHKALNSWIRIMEPVGYAHKNLADTGDFKFIEWHDAEENFCVHYNTYNQFKFECLLQMEEVLAIYVDEIHREMHRVASILLEHINLNDVILFVNSNHPQAEEICKYFGYLEKARVMFAESVRNIKWQHAQLRAYGEQVSPPVNL